MRKTLTDKGVAALKPQATRYAFPDPEMTGHYVRVQPSGTRTFVTVARTPAGKQVWSHIGAADVMAIADARELASKIIKRVRSGLPAIETKADSVIAVAAEWVKRHVRPKKLRSRWEIIRLLKSHIRPAWGDREFISIRRSDVTKLLDHVEDRSGARTADRVLTTFSSIAHWHASRTDDYVPPIARGMRRQGTKEQARDRTLDDAELRAVWAVAETSGAFGSIVKLCLLTAQRSRKVATMKWADIDVTGVWTVPQEPREKDAGGALLLPEMALAIIKAQPRIGSSPYVFPGRGTSGPFNGFNKSKGALDAKLPADMSDWVVHDLRRTARSLMSRAGVLPHIGERVLGHVVGGVAGTYDQFEYDPQKADALVRLAALIENIVHPPVGNVIPMMAKPKKAKRR
jgi:integrase